METYQSMWDQVVSHLKLTVAPQSFEMVFSSPKKAYIEDNKVYVVVVNEHERFMLDKFYIKDITDALSEVSGKKSDIRFVTPDYIEKKKQSFSVKAPDPNVRNYYRGNLNATYTFDRFVAGQSNRTAYLMALQVAERPGEFANPFYIFGEVGLGKTHLMQAVGNYILDNNPEKRILYVTSEKFVDDYRIASIEKNFDKFKKKYRDIDVLLIDDIQFLAKKEQSQEEFFNTFNDLHNENKQIIITSDCPASEIRDMMNRLTSRFEWGLQANIQKPDTQTRIDIMKKKLTGENINVDDFPEEVLEFIASKFHSNVRTLEGALKRLIFFATLHNSEYTVDLAMDALKDLIKEEKRISKIDATNIIKEVGNYYDINPSEIKSKSRRKEINLARQVCMYFIREFTGYSFPRIGSIFGGRDHSTVMHAISKIEKEIKADIDFSKEIERLKKKFI